MFKNRAFSIGAVLVVLLLISGGTVAFVVMKMTNEIQADFIAQRNEFGERIKDLGRSPLMLQSNAGLNPNIINAYNPELKACLLGLCSPDGIGKPQPLALQNVEGTIIMSASAVLPGTGTAFKSKEISSAPLGAWLYFTWTGMPCGFPAALGAFPSCPLMFQTYFTYDCLERDCSKPEKVQIQIHYYVRFNKEAFTGALRPIQDFPPLGTYSIETDKIPASAEPVVMNAAWGSQGFFKK